MGNYLCCESLNAARLHGAERCRDLTPDQVDRLIQALKTTVTKAIERETNSWWRVFQRKLCNEGHKVIRQSVGRRGHYFCPVCQPNLHFDKGERRAEE